MQVARTSVLAEPCTRTSARCQYMRVYGSVGDEGDALREVDVEEVEVERSLHETRGDSDGVDQVLRKVSEDEVSSLHQECERSGPQGLQYERMP